MVSRNEKPEFGGFNPINYNISVQNSLMQKRTLASTLEEPMVAMDWGYIGRIFLPLPQK